MSDFKPTHRQKYADVEAHQLNFENIEKMGKFVSADKIATSNPSGEGLVVTFYAEGKPALRAKMDWWILKNSEGAIACLSNESFEAQFEESQNAHSRG